MTEETNEGVRGMVGANVVVLDLETARSAGECQSCGHGRTAHVGASLRCPAAATASEDGAIRVYAPLGWEHHAALGLSVGCYYDYQDQQIHWFDPPTLAGTMSALVQRQPLVVSFNGKHFDGPLMQAVLCGQQETGSAVRTPVGRLQALLPGWQALWARSYDLLEELWQVAPDDRYQRGNSLEALARATLGVGKTGTGEVAPVLWRRGQYATVLNYCQWDVWLTKTLFERVHRGEPLHRPNGLASVVLRQADWLGAGVRA